MIVYRAIVVSWHGIDLHVVQHIYVAETGAMCPAGSFRRLAL